MIIPLVLVCVVIMSLLGTVLMSSSTAEYSQSALVGYGLRARELALAALEEARAVVYDNLNNPLTARPWHQKLFDACKTQEANAGILFTENIKNALSRSKGLASAAGGELMSAEVAFLGFRQVSFVSSDLFRRPENFYRNVEGGIESGDTQPPREYNGYYRVRVQCRFGKVARVFSEIHDVKIVNVQPPAREFALFSNTPTTDSNGTPLVPRPFIEEGLNAGEGFYIDAKDVGRIFVRGPFVVRTEGWPGGDGEKGGAPRSNDRRSGYNKEHWYKWRTVPAVRDGVVGNVAIFFQRGPARPERTSDSRLLIGMITGAFGGAGDALFGLDPGFNILNGQQWYCESRGLDGKSFSILGDQGFSRFRGIVTEVSNGRRVFGTSNQMFGPADRSGIWSTPPNKNARWVIEPEGSLLGLYNTVSYSYKKFPWPTKIYERYRLSGRGPAIVRLGVHWEPERNQSIFGALFGALFEAGAFALMGFGLGAIPIPALIPLGPTGIFLLGPQAVMLGTIGAAIGAELTRPNDFRRLANINPAAARGIFPPNYRYVRRSVTRNYPKLADLPSFKANNPLLVLDGIIGFDDMNAAKPIRYQGKGYLYSDSPTPPTLSSISQLTPDPKHWMTLHYEGPPENAHLGGQMLGLRAITGSVYSTQGVRTTGAQTQINGNMTCGFINKQELKQSVKVDYKFTTLNQPRPTYDNGSWHVSAISFRASQMYDK
jgi:hypothetical protein